MDWDKYSLLGKAKAACASTANQGIHLMLLTGRQLSSHSQKSRAHHVLWFCGKTNANSDIPLSHSSSQLSLFSMTEYSMGPFFGLGMMYWFCSLPSSKILNLAPSKILQRKFTLFHPKLSHFAMRCKKKSIVNKGNSTLLSKWRQKPGTLSWRVMAALFFFFFFLTQSTWQCNFFSYLHS